MNITFFGTYNTKTTPRVQVLIEGLSGHEIEVNECNVPLKIGTAGRVAILRQPWRLPWLALSIGGCWIRLIARKRHVPAPDAVIVGYMGQFDIHLAHWLFRGRPVILDYMVSGSDTGSDRQVSGSFKDKLLRWLDNSALRLADIIIVDTEERRLALPDKFRKKGVVVDVGASQAWFDATHESTPPNKRPASVVFFGNYTPLQGAPTIGRALKRLKRPVDVTMVGHGQELAATQAAVAGKRDTTTVQWIDWVDSAKLPKMIAEHDICLGIFGTGSKAQQVVPNKVYQGAAAGCAILTADTSPQRRTLNEAAVFVPAGDDEALAQALDKLIGSPSDVARLRRSAHELARKHFTPQKVVSPLLEKINFPV